MAVTRPVVSLVRVVVREKSPVATMLEILPLLSLLIVIVLVLVGLALLMTIWLTLPLLSRVTVLVTCSPNRTSAASGVVPAFKTIDSPDSTHHPRRRSEERRVGKECRSRWSPYH